MAGNRLKSTQPGPPVRRDVLTHACGGDPLPYGHRVGSLCGGPKADEPGPEADEPASLWPPPWPAGLAAPVQRP